MPSASPEPISSMSADERKAALEAIIYAADEPATIEQLAKALGEPKARGAGGARRTGRQLRRPTIAASKFARVAGGYKMYTKPQHHDLVRRFIKSLRPPLRLTMPALETLAVISYKQPVTAPEIQEIRGVNTSGVIKTLLDKTPDHHRGPQRSHRPPDPVPHVERISDALRSQRSRRTPEPEGIRSARARSPRHRRRRRRSGAGDESVLDSLPRRDAIDGQMASEANAEASHALAEQSIPGNHDGDAALASALDSENVPYIAVPRAARGASDRANSEAAGSEGFAGERGADERTSAHSHTDSSSHSDEQRDDDERAAQAHKAVAGE